MLAKQVMRESLPAFVVLAEPSVHGATDKKSAFQNRDAEAADLSPGIACSRAGCVPAQLLAAEHRTG